MSYKYDYSKLLGKLRELHITQAELAKRLDISEVSLNKKLRGNSQFKQEEIYTILNYLGLTVEDVTEYFFCKVTCENAS